MSTRLYGCIVEYGLGNEEFNKHVYSHNEKIITSITDNDELPFGKELFNINFSKFDYGGRIILFGGNFKSIESKWEEWRKEFENLLTKLYWLEADLHFKTKYSGIQTFTWRVDLKKWNLNKDQIFKPIKSEYWDFEGKIDWTQ